jgi:hypothetical protein
MGSSLAVHVGPYAEWLLPRNRADELPEELYAFLLDFPPGSVGLTFHPDPPVVRVGGEERVRKVWSPFFDREAAQQPPRRLDWSNPYATGIEDLSGVDHAAEVEWFRTLFAEHLRRLADLYGEEPTLHWGVITSWG